MICPFEYGELDLRCGGSGLAVGSQSADPGSVLLPSLVGAATEHDQVDESGRSSKRHEHDHTH
jgi:hypothetical protein